MMTSISPHSLLKTSSNFCLKKKKHTKTGGISFILCIVRFAVTLRGGWVSEGPPFWLVTLSVGRPCCEKQQREWKGKKERKKADGCRAVLFRCLDKLPKWISKSSDPKPFGAHTQEKTNNNNQKQKKKSIANLQNPIG